MKNYKRLCSAVMAGALALSGGGAEAVINSLTASAAAVAGDANSDGSFGSADLVTLAEYLTGQKKDIPDWEAADLCSDGKLDVFDLCAMRELMKKTDNGDYSALCINEICASNDMSLKDNSGSSPDWLEIYNSGSTELSLDGIGLSNGAKNKFKFVFSEGTKIGAGEYIVVLCKKGVSEEEGEYRAAFNISATAGDTITLNHPELGELDSVTLPELISDVTYARTSDGGAEFDVLEPTPGSSNNDAAKASMVSKPEFSAKGGFYDAPFDLTITSPAGTEIWYTTDGTDPTISSTAKLYTGDISVTDQSPLPNVYSARRDVCVENYQPPEDPVDKGMILRAAAKSADGTYSKVVSNSYFIGQTESYYKDMKVISITSDPDSFFDEETGIYVCGNGFYQWQRSGGRYDNPDDSRNPTNYNKTGREQERPCNIQVFENGAAVYSEDVGVRISGGWSTGRPQKSLTFYARSEYGAKKMKYDFFNGAARDVNGKKITEFDKIMIRNGGNDLDGTHCRDDVIQSLADGLNFGRQTKANCIVFLDGEFWGYYNLQEKEDDSYVESHFGVNEDDVSIFDSQTAAGNKEYDGTDSGLSDYQNFARWAMSADMSDPANYERFCEQADIDSFIDFIAVESYICNWDCLINPNNWRVWRSNAPDSVNPYNDGKWRWLIYDTEYSSGCLGEAKTMYHYNYIANMSQSQNPGNLSVLFYQLMKNEDFADKFRTRSFQIIDENFDSTRADEEITKWTSAVRTAVLDTHKRFGITSQFDSTVICEKHFYANRPEWAKHYINELCGIGDGFAIPNDQIFDVYSSSIWMNSGSGYLTYLSEDSVRVDVDKIGQYAQLMFLGLSLERGKRYKVEYTISSESGYNTYAQVQLNEGMYTNYYFEGDVHAGQNPEKHTFTFTASDSTTNAKLLFGLDKSTGSVVISDVSFNCLD